MEEYFTALIIYYDDDYKRYDDDYKRISNKYDISIHTTEEKAKRYVCDIYHEYIIDYCTDNEISYDIVKLLALYNNLEEIQKLLDEYIKPDYIDTALGYKITKCKVR
jgi:hypothetical protein